MTFVDSQSSPNKNKQTKKTEKQEVVLMLSIYRKYNKHYIPKQTSHPCPMLVIYYCLMKNHKCSGLK